MKIHYDAETDSLYIDLNSRPSSDAVEVADGLVVDFDEDGKAVGIDIEHASRLLDLKALETEGLPLQATGVWNTSTAVDYFAASRRALASGRPSCRHVRSCRGFATGTT